MKGRRRKSKRILELHLGGSKGPPKCLYPTTSPISLTETQPRDCDLKLHRRENIKIWHMISLQWLATNWISSYTHIDWIIFSECSSRYVIWSKAALNYSLPFDETSPDSWRQNWYTIETPHAIQIQVKWNPKFILLLLWRKSRDSSVGTESRLQAGWSVFQGSTSGWEFSSPPRPEWFWGPLGLLSNGYQELFPWG